MIDISSTICNLRVLNKKDINFQTFKTGCKGVKSMGVGDRL